MIETLGRSIIESNCRGRIQGIMLAPNFLVVTHNQFVDDILIGEVEIMEAKNFKCILED